MAEKKLNIKTKVIGAEKAEGSFKKIGISIAAVTAALAIAGKAISSLTDKFKIQELAEKRLEVALGGVNKSLLAQASALQKSTSFGDEEVIQAQTLIASFVKEEDAIKKATVATLDLAAAKGMDLRAAADLVSKTLGSSTNAMSRYGIQVEGAVGSTERLESLTSNIARVFGGQAAAAMDTYAGRAENLDNAIGDLQESMGRLFAEIEGRLELFEKLANTLDFLSRKVTNNITQFFKLWDGVSKVFNILTNDTIATDENAEAKKRIAENVALANLQINRNVEFVTKSEGAYRKWAEAHQIALDQDALQAEHLARFNSELMPIAIAHQLEELEILEKKVPLLEKIGDGTEFVAVKTKRLTDFQELLIETNERAGEAFKQLGVDFETSTEGYGRIVLNTTRKIISAFIAEGVAGAVKNALESIPFPFNIAAAGIAGGAAAALFNSLVPSFARGGNFTTDGPQLIMVGDNPGGRERVQVTPESSPNVNGPSGLIINFNGNITNKRMIREEIIPEIQTAIRQGAI